MKAPRKAKDVLTEAVATLKASTAIDHWQRDREEIEAEELLAYALGVDGVAPNDEVPPNVRRTFDRMIARRGSGEPVQLITGQAVFRGLQIAARPGVFVPRDSTEYLAEQAVRRLRGRRRPVARENAELLHLRATFAKGDLFGGLPSELKGWVDVITLHPPYVARDELRELPEEIRRFEPVHTLTDRSADGLGLVGRTASEGPRWLKPGGWLLVEVSPDRARSAASVLRRNGFGEVRSTMDRGFKVTRVLVGRWHG